MDCGIYSLTPDIERFGASRFYVVLASCEAMETFTPRIGESCGLLKATMEDTTLNIEVRLRLSMPPHDEQAGSSSGSPGWIGSPLQYTWMSTAGSPRDNVKLSDSRGFDFSWANCVIYWSQFSFPYHPKSKSEVRDRDQYKAAQTCTVRSGDEGHIPVWHKDNVDMFSKDMAETGVPHEQVDHSTDLEPGFNWPYSSIYNHLEVEFTTIMPCAVIQAANGFIQHLSSSMASPIIFKSRFEIRLQLCVNYPTRKNTRVKN